MLTVHKLAIKSMLKLNIKDTRKVLVDFIRVSLLLTLNTQLINLVFYCNYEQNLPTTNTTDKNPETKFLETVQN